jgi:hypothetical protein
MAGAAGRNAAGHAVAARGRERRQSVRDLPAAKPEGGYHCDASSPNMRRSNEIDFLVIWHIKPTFSVVGRIAQVACLAIL